MWRYLKGLLKMKFQVEFCVEGALLVKNISIVLKVFAVTSRGLAFSREIYAFSDNSNCDWRRNSSFGSHQVYLYMYVSGVSGVWRFYLFIIWSPCSFAKVVVFSSGPLSTNSSKYDGHIMHILLYGSDCECVRVCSALWHVSALHCKA